MIFHYSVLLKKITNIIKNIKRSIYIDATFGTGYLTKVLLNNINVLIIAIDCDYSSIYYYKFLKLNLLKRCVFFRDNFININIILNKLKYKKIDVITFDLGISSIQFSDKYRGFSFFRKCVIDMRLDQSLNYTIEKSINYLSLKKILDIINNYCFTYKINELVYNIFKYKKNIILTSDLIDIIKINNLHISCLTFYCTKIFQALRIYLNKELENLYFTLIKIKKYINTKGKILILSFNTLETKIVQNVFNKIINNDIFNKLIKSNIFELSLNIRCRSARLILIKRVK